VNIQEKLFFNENRFFLLFWFASKMQSHRAFSAESSEWFNVDLFREKHSFNPRHNSWSLVLVGANSGRKPVSYYFSPWLYGLGAG
jgi:hypothetical protein